MNPYESSELDEPIVAELAETEPAEREPEADSGGDGSSLLAQCMMWSAYLVAAIVFVDWFFRFSYGVSTTY